MRLFFRVWRALCQPLFLLALYNHEIVVLAKAAPGPSRNLCYFDKLPIRHISRLQPKIIPNRRRNVQSCAMVQIRLRTLVLENVLEMVGPERAAIFPLPITGAIS